MDKKPKYKEIKKELKNNSTSTKLLTSLFAALVAASIVSVYGNINFISVTSAIIAIGLFVVLYLIIKKAENSK